MKEKDVKRMRKLHNEIMARCKANSCGGEGRKNECPFLLRKSGVITCGMRGTKLHRDKNPSKWSKLKKKTKLTK